MGKLLAYVSFLISGALALWFVAGWIDGILRDGLSATAYTLLHWPAVVLTVALPALAFVFLWLGFSVLPARRRD